MAREIRIITAQDQPIDIGRPVANDMIFPNDFANRVGQAAATNQAVDNVANKYTNEGLPNMRNIIVQPQPNNPMSIRDQLYNTKSGFNQPDIADVRQMASDIGVTDLTVVLPPQLNVMVGNIKSEADPNDENATEVVNQLSSYITNTSAISDSEKFIEGNAFFKNQVKILKNQQALRGAQVPARAASRNSRIVTAQEGLGLPAVASPPPANMSNPLIDGQITSMDELKDALLNMGATEETYNLVFNLVGMDNEDSAKSALKEFFKGSSAALCVLYELLIKAGIASPIDESIIGGLMEKHPELFPEEQPVQASLKRGTVTGSYILEAKNGKTLTIKNIWDIPRLAQRLGWDGNGDAQVFVESKVGQDLQVKDMFGKNYDKVVASFNGLFLVAGPDKNTTMEKTASGGVGSTVNMVYDMAGPSDKRYCPKLRNVISTFQCRFNCLDGLVIGDAQVLCGEAIWRRSIMDKFSTEYLNKEGKLEGGYIRDRFIVESTTHEHPALLKPGQRMAPINEDAWSTEKRLQELRRSPEAKARGYSETPGDPKGLYNFDQHELVKGPKAPNLFGMSGRTKEAFNKNKMTKTAGNPMLKNVSMQAGTVCPRCKMKGKENQKRCMNCGTKMEIQSKGTAMNETGAIPKSDIAASVANGVYRITKGEVTVYGSSIKEALGKLKGLVPQNPDQVGQEEEQLTKLIQQKVEEQQLQQQQQPGSPGQQTLAAPPQKPVQPNLAQPKPAQPLPGQQAPLGQSLQPKPLGQKQINPQLQQHEGKEFDPSVLEDEEGAHIQATALDSFLDVTEEKDPEAKKEMEGLAEKTVLGPERKVKK